MVEKYEVMDVDLLDEWEHAEEVDAIDYEDAAEEYIEDRWADWDYPESVDLIVRRKGSDECVRVSVWAEQTTVFRARVMDTPRSGDAAEK